MDVQEEIYKIINKIGKSEYKQKGLIDDEIRELGVFVMSVHEVAETFMDDLIVKHITFSKSPPEQEEKLKSVLGRVAFWEKVKICQEMKLFKGIKGIVGCFETINSLRNKFFHPLSYRSELNIYISNDKSYLEILRKLECVLDKVSSQR